MNYFNTLVTNLGLIILIAVNFPFTVVEYKRQCQRKDETEAFCGVQSLLLWKQQAVNLV